MRSEARGVAYYSIPAPDISLLCLALFLGLGHACMHGCQRGGWVFGQNSPNKQFGRLGLFWTQARSDDVDVAAY